MALYPVSGCKFYIGNAAMDEQDDDFVVADFAGVSWVEVSKWTQFGAIGDTAALISTDLISEARTKKQKGTRNAGPMENTFAVDALNAGQIAMIAAETTFNNYPFRMILNDAPILGSSPFPSERLCVGLVMTAQEQGGAANTVRALSCTVEINSNIVRVAAGPGT